MCKFRLTALLFVRSSSLSGRQVAQATPNNSNRRDKLKHTWQSSGNIHHHDHDRTSTLKSRKRDAVDKGALACEKMFRERERERSNWRYQVSFQAAESLQREQFATSRWAIGGGWEQRKRASWICSYLFQAMILCVSLPFTCLLANKRSKRLHILSFSPRILLSPRLLLLFTTQYNESIVTIEI